MARISPTKSKRFNVDVNVPDDKTLLRKIAKDQSKPAFTELTERYHNRAFNLACRITGDQDSALDALQEALCRIWRSADSYKEQGEARAWIMKIVAHTAIVQLKKKKRNSRLTPLDEVEAQDFSSCKASEKFENQEALDLLRPLLDALPQTDQRLIALYFGGGMNQEEIGAVLEMAQTTVSSRLQSITKRLKSGLRQAGLTTGMTSILETQLLQGALECGSEWSRLRPVELVEAAFSTSKINIGQRTFAGWTFNKFALTFLSVSVIGYVGWIGVEHFNTRGIPPIKSPEAVNISPVTQSIKRSSAWKIAPTSGDFQFNWDFTVRQLNGAKFGLGTMRWLPSEDTPTRGLEAIGDGCVLVLPVLVTHRDFVVEVHCETKSDTLTLGLQTGATPKAFKCQRWNLYTRIDLSRLTRATWIFKGSRSYCFLNGIMISSTEYPKGRGDGLALSLKSISISKIIVRSHGADESKSITKSMESEFKERQKHKRSSYSEPIFFPIPAWYKATHK